MLSSTEILYALSSAALTGLIAFLVTRTGDKAKTKDEVLDKALKDIEQLKVTAVTENRVREIIKDAIEPTSTDVKEIKKQMEDVRDTLHSIELKLTAESAFRRGKLEKERGEHA